MNFARTATRISLSALLLSGLALLPGCATGAASREAQDAPVLVWPPAPDIARVKFVRAIYSNRDVQAKAKRSFKDVLTGTDEDQASSPVGQPMDLVTDSKGRLLVTDTRNQGIHVFDLQKRTFARYGTSGENALRMPMGIDVDGEDNIYVADAAQKLVVKMNAKGEVLTAFGEFVNPVGVAVDRARGRLYVADSKAHLVQVFDLAGQALDTLGEPGVEEGQFNAPTYCAVDSKGSLYVVDTLNARVQVFSPELELVGVFGERGLFPGQFTRPKGIAVDRHGIIYVVDGAFNNIQMFDAELRLLMPFSDPGQAPGSLNLPTGIHVAENGAIYVADLGNNRIEVFQLLSAESEESLKKTDDR